MSPLNRGPLLGPRMPPTGMRPRFGGRLPMPGMPPRMPPPMGPMFGPMRQRMMPPRPGGIMRPGGPPPLFVPRGRGVPPLMPPMMCPRGMGPRGPPMRPGLRGLLPPQGLPHMRPRFPMGNGNITSKAINNAKKVSKLEELEMKKPWMTDEIRSEIQKKNKLYAKAKKNKDAKEWNEFKDLRNKVTRMIRDAKNEYLTKNPDQAHIYQDDNEPYDQRDENYVSSEDETSHYCEVCDRDFNTVELLEKHAESHKTCGIDGCTFSAHPKLVEKHISMQHCTGLYRRMKNLSTPEDIEKWIAERKKKYPTKINIEQKKAQESEKQERGEIIMKNNTIHDVKHKEKSIREKKRKVRKRKTPELKAEPESLTDEWYRGVRPFAGTCELLHFKMNSGKKGRRKRAATKRTDSKEHLTNLRREISDEKEETQTKRLECETESEVVSMSCEISGNISDEDEPINSLPCEISSVESPEIPAKVEQSCLGSLVADYGSDSSDDEGPEQVPIKRIRTDLAFEKDSRLVSEISIAKPMENSVVQIKDDSKSKEKKHSESTNSRTRTPWEKPNDKTSRNNATGYRDKKRLMLLQRLLSRSIQHERNIICQCIKYIADNNFFDNNL